MTEDPRKNKPDSADELSEAEFEQYLDGDSSVSAAYREMGATEPPDSLDQKILQEARATASTNAKNNSEPGFLQRWGRPLGTLAVMGVCLSVVFNLIDQRGTTPAVIFDDARESMATANNSNAPGEMRLKDLRSEILLRDTPMSIAVEPMIREEMAGTVPDDFLRELKNEPQQEPASKRLQAGRAKPSSESLAMSDAEEPAARPSSESMLMRDKEVAVTAAQRSEDLISIAPAPETNPLKPSASIWLSGIESLLECDETEWADEELAKIARVFPAETAWFRKTKGIAAAESGVSKEMTDDPKAFAASTESEDEAASEEDAKESAAMLYPNPDVWSYGINKLINKGEQAAADAELEKLRQIYPDYK